MLPQKWIDWLIDAVNRNCDHEEMIDKMIDTGIKESVARQALADVLENQMIRKSGKYIYGNPIFNHKGNFIETTDGRVVHILCRIEKPVIAVLENVLSNKECDYLMELSNQRIARSTVVNTVTGENTVSDYRTSSGASFKRGEDETINTIEKRLAEIMNCPIENGEGLQILNYQVGEQYKPHYDYFDPRYSGNFQHLQRGGQRVSTLVLYLNEVPSGGETGFPEIGMTVSPKKGSAVYFEYCNARGQVDPMTLHSGMPVKEGEKWIATKWTRQREFN